MIHHIYASGRHVCLSRKSKSISTQHLSSNVVYICSISWLLADKLSDLSQAEKKIIVAKSEQIQKMATIFTQSDNFWSLSFCEFAQVWQQLLSSHLEINQVIQEPTANCLNRCRPPWCCNKHFIFIKVLFLSDAMNQFETIFYEPITYRIIKLITFSFIGLRMPWS